MTNPDPRCQQLTNWLGSLPSSLKLQLDSLRAASADASFRRYFRIDALGEHRTLVAMDAPPDKEDVGPFIKVAGLLQQAQLNAPRVIAQDVAAGFLLLTDLGPHTFLQAIQQQQAEPTPLMLSAIDALVRWQQASRPNELPPYDEALLARELALFPDWYVTRHLQKTLSDEQRHRLAGVEQLLIRSALAQPQVFVHRDYMPRNLMVSEPMPGILDFQDAVYGPVTYDVISLLRDAFMSWEEEQVLDWAVRYWEKARKLGLLGTQAMSEDFGEFYRAMEWMGLQRHLKVLGIFARINYRDGKPHYLADTPRFVRYVRQVAQRYALLAPLLRLMDDLEPMPSSSGYTF